MSRSATIWAVLQLLALAACSGGGTLHGPAAPPFGIGPLPDAARHAAAISPVDGADFDLAGPGTAVVGTALSINGKDIDYSWARYAFDVPAGSRLSGVSLDVQDVQGEYWVAFSDYGTRDAWEWHGPLTDDASPAFNLPAGNYVSPARTFYWVVLAVRDDKLRLNSTAVDCSMLQLFPATQGESLVVSGDCNAPSLVHLPQIDPNVQAGAPLIAYVHLEGGGQKLYFAYVGSGGWQQQAIRPDHDFDLPQLRWLGTEGILTAYDLTDGVLLDMRFDQALNITSTTTIMSGVGLAPVRQSLDVGPGSEIGVAHAYADSTTGKLFYAWNDGSGWQNTAALHDGDLVGGVSFRYDPLGGDPWLMYTHGTIDNSAAILISFALEQGRLHGGTWTFTPVVADPDSPLSVDLDFAADGTPQVCFLAARDYSISFPISFTASLLYDVVVGVKSGNTWNMDPVFTGTLTPHFTFPDNLTMDVDDGTGVRWTTASELLYSRITGTVQVDIATQQPTGGTLTPTSQYMTSQGSSYINDDRFTASPGHNFSWSLGVDGFPAAAYIKSQPVAGQDLFSGQGEQASDLIYWRWFPPPPD
jgi:hypothetical protein